MTRPNNVLTAALLWLTAFALGCNAARSPDPTSSTVASTSPPHDVSDSVNLELSIVDRAGFDETIAKYRGQVVLVDFWATWCLHCCEQFPHTVQLSQKYSHKNLAVVSVSMDEPDATAQITEFLSQSGADFEHLVSRYGVGQKGFEAFEIADGEIPFYALYDRQGSVRFTSHEPNQIDLNIKKLLREASD